MAPAKKKEKRGAGRAARTLRSLIAITALGVALGLYNAVSLRRDVGLAVGSQGSAQEQFFRDSADRPDIATFFKNLTPGQRLAMARNIGRYSDPELAKLCGKCLDTFDPSARSSLTDSLAVVTRAHPSATAALLNLPGSFQQLAIATALRSAGPSALPLVAKQFSDGDARPNAVAFLVASGAPAAPAATSYLSSTDKDVRMAAADVLGKIRARSAVVVLTRMLDTTDKEERLAYLTALAGIGDPASEGLMTRTLDDESLPSPHRVQAALGLGVICSNRAVHKLWDYAHGNSDKSLSDGAVSGLQLAGDRAFPFEILAMRTDHSPVDVALLKVAGGIRSDFADSIIEGELSGLSQDIRSAAQVSVGRSKLVPRLVEAAKVVESNKDGETVDLLLRALATTDRGRAALKQFAASGNQSLAALAARRLAL